MYTVTQYTVMINAYLLHAQWCKQLRKKNQSAQKLYSGEILRKPNLYSYNDHECLCSFMLHTSYCLHLFQFRDFSMEF